MQPASRSATRALVLGGGGSVGNAWVIGVVAGLFEAGLDVTSADLVIGTSSGSTAAAQLTSVSPSELYAAVVDAPAPVRPGPGGVRGRVAGGAVVNHLERTGRIIAAAADADDMRRRMGAAAIDLAEADGGASGRWRETVAARLPNMGWPLGNLFVTAVDARTGEPVGFDRECGIELVDAVAASCSSGAAYAIGDGWYIDGGYRRNENADLAAGHARVLVLSPFGGRSRHPVAWGLQLDAQVEELRAAGSTVDVVVPDEASLAVFGETMMDLSRRAPSAREGHRQGTALAGVLAESFG